MTDPLLTRISGTDHKVDQLKEALERIENHREGNQNVTTIRFEGGKSAVVSLLVGLVGGVCLGVSVAVTVWVSSAMQSQATMNNWTSQEVTAIRSYITNGKLQPMKARPMDSTEPEKDRVP